MYKTLHGLVLREVVYKESSKMLTILTEEEGKIAAEAKGVLKKGSKCAAAAQCLTWSELTFSEYRGRYTLTEASVLEDFSALRADIADYALGCYFSEMLEAVSVEGLPDKAVLQLGLNSLFALSRKLYEPEQIKAVFELRLMCLSGFAPALERCLACGKTDMEDPRLSLYGGSLHCVECPPDSSGRSLPLCRDSLAAMRYVVAADAKKVFSFSLNGEASVKFCRACEEYALAQLDRGFKTLDYWHQYK